MLSLAMLITAVIAATLCIPPFLVMSDVTVADAILLGQAAFVVYVVVLGVVVIPHGAALHSLSQHALSMCTKLSTAVSRPVLTFVAVLRGAHGVKFVRVVMCFLTPLVLCVSKLAAHTIIWTCVAVYDLVGSKLFCEVVRPCVAPVLLAPISLACELCVHLCIMSASILIEVVALLLMISVRLLPGVFEPLFLSSGASATAVDDETSGKRIKCARRIRTYPVRGPRLTNIGLSTKKPSRSLKKSTGAPGESAASPKPSTPTTKSAILKPLRKMTLSTSSTPLITLCSTIIPESPVSSGPSASVGIGKTSDKGSKHARPILKFTAHESRLTSSPLSTVKLYSYKRQTASAPDCDVPRQESPKSDIEDIESNSTSECSQNLPSPTLEPSALADTQSISDLTIVSTKAALPSQFAIGMCDKTCTDTTRSPLTATFANDTQSDAISETPNDAVTSLVGYSAFPSLASFQLNAAYQDQSDERDSNSGSDGSEWVLLTPASSTKDLTTVAGNPGKPRLEPPSPEWYPEPQLLPEVKRWKLESDEEVAPLTSLLENLTLESRGSDCQPDSIPEEKKPAVRSVIKYKAPVVCNGTKTDEDASKTASIVVEPAGYIPNTNRVDPETEADAHDCADAGAQTTDNASQHNEAGAHTPNGELIEPNVGVEPADNIESNPIDEIAGATRTQPSAVHTQEPPQIITVPAAVLPVEIMVTDDVLMTDSLASGLSPFDSFLSGGPGLPVPAPPSMPSSTSAPLDAKMWCGFDFDYNPLPPSDLDMKVLDNLSAGLSEDPEMMLDLGNPAPAPLGAWMSYGANDALNTMSSFVSTPTGLYGAPQPSAETIHMVFTPMGMEMFNRTNISLDRLASSEVGLNVDIPVDFLAGLELEELPFEVDDATLVMLAESDDIVATLNEMCAAGPSQPRFNRSAAPSPEYFSRSAAPGPTSMTCSSAVGPAESGADLAFLSSGSGIFSKCDETEMEESTLKAMTLDAPWNVEEGGPRKLAGKVAGRQLRAARGKVAAPAPIG